MLLHVKDEYVGYCLDQAVGFFGSKVENALEQAEEKVRARKGKVRESAIKAARLGVLKQYGIIVEGSKQETRQFADPALMFQ